MKIQIKTTILFTVLTGAIFLVLNVTVYFFIRSFVNNDFNKRLELRTKLSAKFTFEPGDKTTEAFREIQRQYLEKLPEEEGYLFDADSLMSKSYTTSPGQLPYSFIKNIRDNDGQTAFYEHRFRHFAGILYKDTKKDYIVIKSATNQYGSHMMRQLRIINILVLVGAIALIYGAGLYFAKTTFKPIRDIINKVKQITEANLHLRLQERTGADEITELTGTFNQMLNRLETAFETQNNFISNASHELRTPLTAITGEADLALSRNRTTNEYQQSLHKIIHQSEKLKELTKGLLSLAQTGFDGKKQLWEPIRLDELLFDIKVNCNAILPDNKVQVNITTMPEDEALASIKGNYDLLKIALSNIVINACKYSDNKPVEMKLLFGDNKVIIEVSDSGIGIPKDELKNIYDPFFRASNVKGYDGFGIGMPLSNNIIRLHKGTIQVASTLHVGTVVKIILPIS
ncbi:MAG: HAMP domain-containing sensor histidine kinase [Ferruginibacter sp.]